MWNNVFWGLNIILFFIHPVPFTCQLRPARFSTGIAPSTYVIILNLSYFPQTVLRHKTKAEFSLHSFSTDFFCLFSVSPSPVLRFVVFANGLYFYQHCIGCNVLSVSTNLITILVVQNEGIFSNVHCIFLYELTWGCASFTTRPQLFKSWMALSTG